MLKAVRGVYDRGVARPVEPLNIVGRHDVIITFINGKRRMKAPMHAQAAWQKLLKAARQVRWDRINAVDEIRQQRGGGTP